MLLFGYGLSTLVLTLSLYKKFGIEFILFIFAIEAVFIISLLKNYLREKKKSYKLDLKIIHIVLGIFVGLPLLLLVSEVDLNKKVTQTGFGEDIYVLYAMIFFVMNTFFYRKT